MLHVPVSYVLRVCTYLMPLTIRSLHRLVVLHLKKQRTTVKPKTMKLASALKSPLFAEEAVERPGNPYKGIVVKNTNDLYDVIGQ